jgi:IS30 family transposase
MNQYIVMFIAIMNIITALKKLKNHVKSITFDQGVEFSKYQWIKECIKTNIYFCDPASPYQKGSIENGNGVLRREFKRDHDADKLKQREISHMVSIINNRPLKCLGYCTPLEAFEKATYEN